MQEEEVKQSPFETLREQIKRLADALEKIQKIATRRTLLLMLRDETGLSFRLIDRILSALPRLEKRYFHKE